MPRGRKKIEEHTLPAEAAPDQGFEGTWRPGKAGRPPLATRPHEVMTEEEQQFEISDLYSPHSRYSVEDKVRAASAMMIAGTSIAASKLCGVPAGTIRFWSSNAVWWHELMRAVRKEKQEELDAAQTNVIHKSLEEINDRLENGEEVWTAKGKRRKKVGARDLAIIHGTLFDKRQLLRGDPTSKVARSDSDAIEALAQRFEKFAMQMKDSGNMAKPVTGEVVDDAKSK